MQNRQSQHIVVGSNLNAKINDFSTKYKKAQLSLTNPRDAV